MRSLDYRKSTTLLVAAAAFYSLGATAQSGKLLLTGGVSQIEGASGGGLTPWAVIGGYGTREQIGANAFHTNVRSGEFNLASTGIMVGLFDRAELSYARQRFDTRDAGARLGLGRGFTFNQDVVGLKVKLAGDAVLDQDRWLPQIAIGLQHKRNDRDAIVRFVGATKDIGTDYYINATKLFLSQSVLANITLRATKANQLGILGFGGDLNDRYRAMFEGSLAYLFTRNIAVGVEYRQKPNNLRFTREDDWFDAFIAYAPIKNVSLTAAYANLGSVASFKSQKGVYLSAQIGF
jgi:Protein of unknown function (DUF3034)